MLSSDSRNPRVSVVMAVHNDEAYVQEAIDSILEQTFTDFEFIVIDDGSTDSTPDILQQAAQTDSRVRIVPQRHRGLPRSLNHGISVARGEYIARQDGDDASTDDRLEIQIDFLDSCPEVAMVGSRAEVMDREGYTMQPLMFPTDHEQLYQALHRNMVFQHGSLVFRKEAIEAIGGYRPEFPIVEDYDLLLRFMERYEVANIPEVLYYYRRTGNNMTASWGWLVDLYMRLARDCVNQRRLLGRDIFMFERPATRSGWVTPLDTGTDEPSADFNYATVLQNM